MELHDLKELLQPLTKLYPNFYEWLENNYNSLSIFIFQ